MLQKDQQDAVDDAGDYVHDEGDHQGCTERVPTEQGEGDTFYQCNQQIDDKQCQKTEDKQQVGGGRSGDIEEEVGGHGGDRVIRKLATKVNRLLSNQVIIESGR